MIKQWHIGALINGLLSTTVFHEELSFFLLWYESHGGNIHTTSWHVLVCVFFPCIFCSICLPTSAFLSPLATVSEQIISSSTPCGDFFFRGCRTSESQRVDVASSRTSSSSKCHGYVHSDDRASYITSIVKKCNELDLKIIIIWKVHNSVVLSEARYVRKRQIILDSWYRHDIDHWQDAVVRSNQKPIKNEYDS